MRDDRGAVMLVGLFMAVLSVGLVYTLMGIGETINYQEEVQHAADAAAFSAAAGHARAMNSLALVNRSISTTSATLSAFTIMDVAFSPALCQLPHGQCEQERARHAQNRASSAPRAEEMMRAATRAAERLLDVTGQAANEEVARVARETHGERVLAAFLVPAPMPFTRGSLSPACGLANVHAFELAREAMGALLFAQTLGERTARRDPQSFQCASMAVPGAGPLLPVPPNLPVGTEPFQLRVGVIGDAARVRGLGAGVRLPQRTIGRPGTSGRSWAAATGADPGSTFAIAQAEYYCDWEGANQREDSELRLVVEDAFRMCWRARLRRVRVPTAVALNDVRRDEVYARWVRDRLLPACGDACLPLLGQIGVANDAIH